MIRLARIEDLKEVVEIYNQAIDAGFQTAYITRHRPEDRVKWFLSHLEGNFPLYVYIENDHHVAGWVSISPYRADRGALRFTVEISYFIHRDYQRKGIGTLLLARGLQACRELHYKNAIAIIMDNNSGSIRLMEKFGFERWGYLPGVAEFDGIECGQYYYGKRIDR